DPRGGPALREELSRGPTRDPSWGGTTRGPPGAEKAGLGGRGGRLYQRSRAFVKSRRRGFSPSAARDLALEPPCRAPRLPFVPPPWTCPVVQRSRFVPPKVEQIATAEQL